MQSCPKNAHTGTGPPNKAKGPVSANTKAIAENNPKTTPSAACKIENILATSMVITESELFNGKRFETSEVMTTARGTSKPPTVIQPEVVQPSETNLNNVTSDNVSLSQRKQPRVGKSMERERQQQQHIGFLTTLENVNHHSDEIPQFKQEFSVKREGEVKVERDCETELQTGYRSMNVKLERPEPLSAKPVEKEREELTVNLTVESGDECIDYSTKRKLIDTSNDDVIELSDNSTVEPTMATLKRRKLLEKPVCTPKKSPPNSYKSLIKQSSPSSTLTSPTSKQKLISATFNRSGGKASLKRRNILKSKITLKKMRLAVKAKKLANKKKAETNGDSIKDTEEKIVPDMMEEIAEDSLEKSDDNVEEISTENEQNEEKSMDGSSEYSGKSNIDLTIDRVAKGYFSESDIFSCLSKQRKTKSQKKFAAKLLKKGKQDALIAKKKKKAKASKEAEKDGDIEVEKKKKTKTKENGELSKKNSKKKKLEIVVEQDPLTIDEIPASHSTPKRKPKTPKKTKKPKVNDVVEKPVELPLTLESDEDDKTTVETIEPRDEETSTSVLSSTQTINTTKSILDETDVANNNNECFEDNNRQKQQESLTLYKTPGYGWATFNKGKRGKKAKFSNRKKHKFTLLNDIVIPKSTSIPRWSNGWVWEGEPFQALVFLNVSFD